MREKTHESVQQQGVIVDLYCFNAIYNYLIALYIFIAEPGIDCGAEANQTISLWPFIVAFHGPYCGATLGFCVQLIGSTGNKKQRCTPGRVLTMEQPWPKCKSQPVIQAAESRACVRARLWLFSWEHGATSLLIKWLENKRFNIHFGIEQMR